MGEINLFNLESDLSFPTLLSCTRDYFLTLEVKLTSECNITFETKCEFSQRREMHFFIGKYLMVAMRDA